MLSGQFTYASVPEPGPFSDADGWKVQRLLPEDAALRPWVEAATASLGAFIPQPLPLLASRAEVDALPRRLRLEVHGDRRATLLHQVSAGQSHHHRDSSFTHGLLVSGGARDHSATGPVRTAFLDGIRPAELWDSPAWLRPAGADEVSSVELVGDPELAASSLLPAECWAEDRALALLLLAVVESGLTRRSGPRVSRVALIDPTGALTARWVGFLGRYLPPGAGWRYLTFSTHERSIEGAAAALSGLRVIGIPPEEAVGARRSLGADWLVLDPADPPALTDRGETSPAVGTRDAGWNLSAGRWLPLGPWTQLAERLTFLDDMGMDSAADLVDRLSSWCAGSADDRPLWALPAALLTAPDEVVRATAQLAGDAARLAQAHWPTALVLPPDRQATLLQAFSRSSPDPVGGFEIILKSVDQRGVPPGSGDLALEGYVKSLWGADFRGGPPAWVSRRGALPWLPGHLGPSPELAQSLLDELDGLLAWAIDPAAPLDPVGEVRLLASVTEVFARWGRPDLAPVATSVTDHLVEAMLTTLRTGSPAAEGSWPLLRPAVFERVRDRLERLLVSDPGVVLGPLVARWLDVQCGRLDERKPLARWTMLELDRAQYVADGGVPTPGPITGGTVIRGAALLRRALAQAPDRPWPLAEWLTALGAVFGPSSDPIAPHWLLEVVVDKGIPAPVLPLGEAVLSAVPLGASGHALAQWLVQPRVTGSSSMAPFGPVALDRFPAVSLHAWCAPALPPGGELAGNSGWARELRTLAAQARHVQGVLLDTASVRLAADILLVNGEFVGRRYWPWAAGPGDPGADGLLTGSWDRGFALLDQTFAGQPAQRLALARSLLVRALLSDLVRESPRDAPRGYADPAGPWLSGRLDPQKDDWRVEPWIKELIGGADRAEKQQWILDTRTEAARVAELLGGTGDFRQLLLAQVDQNAPGLAWGALGSRLPFNRVPRDRRSGGDDRVSFPSDDLGWPGMTGPEPGWSSVRPPDERSVP